MPGSRSWMLAAGTRLSLFYLPFMARCSPCNKICKEAELGDGWEMAGGRLPAPAWTSPKDISLALGASQARPRAKLNAELNAKSHDWG